MLEVKLAIDYPELRIRAEFAVENGQAAALMGESGSGKSSVINAIAGFGQSLHSHHNQVQLNDDSLDALPPAKRPLSVVFQAHNLFMHLSVAENLAIGLNPRRKLNADQAQAAQQCLAAVGLAGFEQRLPESLSGGQQQRVALARALARVDALKQPLLLLDEPFNGLDAEARSKIIAELNTRMHERGLIVVIATHQSDDAKRLNATTVAIETEARSI